jgi:autotransporter-associated beta strand protein
MKPDRAFLSLFVLVSALMASEVTVAQSGTWVTLSGTTPWSTAGNWSGSTIANGADSTAFFTANINGALAVTLNDVGRTIGNITFTDSTTDSHNMTISGSNALTLDRTSGIPIVDVTQSSRTLFISTTIAGSDGFAKEGPGVLSLSGNNSYTGATALNVGIVSVSHANALGTTAGVTTIAATGNSTTGGRLLISGTITLAEDFSITGNTESAGFQSAINSSSGSNTLSGNITLNNPSGAIRIGASQGTSLLLSGTVSQTTSSQSLVFQASGNSTSITVSNPIANNGGGLTIFGTALTGNGIVRLNAASGAGIGNTSINQNGTLQAGVANVLNTTGNLTIGVNGTNNDRGTFDLAGFDQTVNGLIGTPAGTSPSGNSFRVVTSSAASGTSTLTVGNGNGSATFNGVVNNGPTAVVAFTKVGTGTQTLAGVNAYGGATNVNGGTLAISGNGSINATSAINVAAGARLAYNSSVALTVAPTLNGSLGNRATLGGNGTINAAIALDSAHDVLSPGNSPGVLGFGTNQSWGSYAYEWELNDWVDKLAGTNIDQIAITGTLTLTGAAPGSYIVDVLSLTAGNVAGNVPGFTETNNTWTILTTTGGIAGFDAAFWSVNTAGFSSSPVAGGTWSVAQSGNNLILNYVAVPEPAALALMASGGFALAVLRRRRRGSLL